MSPLAFPHETIRGGGAICWGMGVGYLRKNEIPIDIYVFLRFLQMPSAAVGFRNFRFLYEEIRRAFLRMQSHHVLRIKFPEYP